MNSEYLDRLKHLRDSKTPVGETAAVQTNVSFRKAIDYIEKLESNFSKLKQIADHELAVSAERKNKIHELIEQREADVTILRCGIAAKYTMPINGAPVALQDKYYNKAIDAAIEIINEHYNEG